MTIERRRNKTKRRKKIVPGSPELLFIAHVIRRDEMPGGVVTIVVSGSHFFLCPTSVKTLSLSPGHFVPSTKSSVLSTPNLHFCFYLIDDALIFTPIRPSLLKTAKHSIFDCPAN